MVVDMDSTEICVMPIYDRRLLWPQLRNGHIDDDEVGVQAILECLLKLPIDLRIPCAEHIVVCGDNASSQMDELDIIFNRTLDQCDRYESLRPLKKVMRLFRESAFPPLTLAWVGASIVSCLPHVSIRDTTDTMGSSISHS